MARKPDFSNTEIAYRYKSTQQLLIAKRLFSTFKFPLLVKYGPKIIDIALKLHFPIRDLLKKYLFYHFCGGETLEEALKTAKNLYEHGVEVLLDYAVESQASEEGYEKATNEFLKIIDVAHQKAEVSSIALKPSALCNTKILEKKQAGQKLTKLEQSQYDNFVQRLDKICNKAASLKQILYIDAEESWIQDEIDDVCEILMEKYNKDEPYIFTTIQMYRIGRLEYLKKLTLKAEKKNFRLGIKIVRGAYMEKERQRARKLKYPSPIQPNKKATDRDYNKAVEYCLHRLDRISICVATHNECSCMMTTEIMKELKIAPNDKRIYFSQLYGMADHISFNLAYSGYNVAKYLPYGPLEETLAYLFRRAEENSSIAGHADEELKRIQKELHRRKIAGKILS